MAPIDSTHGEVNTSTISYQALLTAQSQVSQSESPIGSNRGPMVDEYLHSVGLSPGYAWCQAFVYWCYEATAKKLGLQNPIVKTGGVHDCWNHSLGKPGITVLLKQDTLKNPELIKPGDQFMLLFGGATGHTGLVESVERGAESGTWILHTIEGNSNNTGSREGYEVVRHQRNLSDKALQGFLRYS